MNSLERILEFLISCFQFLLNKLLSLFQNKEIIEFDNGRKVCIGKKIADGGFSVVFEASDYSAIHRSENKPCFALKRVICGDSETVEKCREEANVHRAFNHTNLLPLLGLKFTNKGPNNATVCYMLLPLLKSSLRDEITERGLLQKNPMPEDIRLFHPREMVEIFGGVVDAVSTMHDRGFTHRDIKVENIMLDSMRTPILMDFGSVGPETIMLRSRTDCLSLVEEAASNTTMPYRAPELFDGGSRHGEDEPVIDGRVDVWALGCVLFAMMYGASPFECEFRGENVNIVDCSHLRVLGNIPTPEPHTALASRYDPELTKFVKWMLTQDRTLRPRISEVVERLDDLIRKYGGTRRWQGKGFMMASSETDDFV